MMMLQDRSNADKGYASVVMARVGMTKAVTTRQAV
jgi:hypothetical protein